MKQITFLLILTVLFSYCDSNNSATKNESVSQPDSKVACKYGQPVAVFSDSLTSILSHKFELNGQKAVEEVKFENGVFLELYQSGCNEIIQEFRFILNEPFEEQPKEFWFKKAAYQFSYLSTLDERYIVSYNMWSQILSRMHEFTSLGEKFEVEQSTFFSVNTMKEGDQTMLIVIFERNV